MDSRFRNLALYPTPATYVMGFDDVLKNVVSVELVSAVYEKVTPEMYLSLHIEEFNTYTISNSPHIKKSFTTLPLEHIMNMYNSHQFQSITRFESPILKLNKLTISFVAPGGKPYNMKDHLLLFDVCTLKHTKIPDWSPIQDDPYTLLGISRHSTISRQLLVQAFKTKYKAWVDGGGNSRTSSQDPYVSRLKQAFNQAVRGEHPQTNQLST